MKPSFVLITMFCCLLAGCLPYPHTIERSSEVRGRVLDARTHLPIKGAKVCFVQSPQHTTYTDANGYFHLKAVKNFHFGVITPGADWPDRKISSRVISHPNYITIGGDWSGDAGDILLKPKQ
jgi:hypothetical protein